MGTVADMGDVIAELGSGSYTVHRYGPLTYSSGVASAPEETTFVVVASAQPMTGRELSRLPEGLRSKEVQEFFCVEKLRTAQEQEETGEQPDDVEIEGELWQVQTAEDWRTLAGYFRAVVARKKR